MKTKYRSSYLSGSVLILCFSAMVLFTATNANAITPDKDNDKDNYQKITPDNYQKLLNSLQYFDIIPSGEAAILNDCDMKTEEYKILFGAVHGVRASFPNMPEFKGNKFIIILGYGKNGYAGPWGYEIFTEPRADRFFTITIGKTESVRPVWFMVWHYISAEEFAFHCKDYVPYDPLSIGKKTWDSDAGKPIK